MSLLAFNVNFLASRGILL